MSSDEPLDKSVNKASTFHTPPVDSSRSWLAEKESYGIEEDQQHFTDLLGIKVDTKAYAHDDPSASTEAPPLSPNSASKTHPVRRKPVHRASSTTAATSDDVSSVESSDSSGSTPNSLPPPLATAVEQFVQSLKEPKFAAPLDPSAVSALYQEFYSYFAAKADHYLQTGGHLPPKKREIQMETYEEIAEKRKERSLRPVRLREYEETAEARACATVFERIYRPGVGDDVDRARDIQERVAVMRQVVKLKHLDFDTTGSILEGQSEDEREKTMYAKMAPAGEAFALMNAEGINTPLAKLDHLMSGHKLVVQALNELFPNPKSKASADMIIPALIYALLTYETCNLWLDLAFISRFRNAALLAGEPSYILTNFQAAVGFLESATLESLGLTDTEAPEGVDLSILTAGVPENRQSILEMSLQPIAPAPQTHKFFKGLSHRVSLPSLAGKDSGASNRRASMMLAPNGIVTSADQAFKNLGQSFGNSYRFFLNKANNDKSPSTEGGQPLLSDSYAAIKLRRSLSTETGNHSAIPATPPTATKPTFDGPAAPPISEVPPATVGPEPEHANHILGRFASMSMIKSFASPSPSAAVTPASRPSSPPPTLLKKPLDKLAAKDWESLTMAEAKAVHEDYKRLVAYLKDIHAFEK